MPELIALAKSKPGGLDCASTGVGTVQHVTCGAPTTLVKIGSA